MEDLLPLQIKDSCKLALPEGLSDLISDISREVLRYQPRNLYQFIADYLSALLVTRENLSIAANICTNVNDCGCQPELERELQNIGLSEEDAGKAKEIILKYFEKGTVNEGNLIQQLSKKTSIDENMMPAIQEAIRIAYLRHQQYHTTIFESSSDSEDDQDEIKCAAKHSLSLYKKTLHSQEPYHSMATKIQAAYRAFGVRRRCTSKGYKQKAGDSKSADKSVTLSDIDTKMICKTSSYDISYPDMRTSQDMLSGSSSSWPDEEIAASSSMHKKRVATMSSTCIAGSFITLPPDKPYSAHDPEDLYEVEETPEREYAYLDYTAENPHFSVVIEGKIFKGENSKRISFSESPPEAAKMGLEAEDDIDSRDYFSLDHTAQSSIDASEDLLYPGDVRSEDNYDGDTEVDVSVQSLA